MTPVEPAKNVPIGHPDAPSAWEAAYMRFETPQQEIQKFRARLLSLGVGTWSRDLEILEVCCGRGSGLRAWHSLGFRRVGGLDLSPVLAGQYQGPGRIIVGDCRALPLRDASRDVIAVQGGLHHLLALPDDLDRALLEAARVLRPRGRLLIVEPWLTPFLRLMHGVCRLALVRRLSDKVDALATMIDHEKDTYFRWLSHSELIHASLRKVFVIEFERRRWGKFSCIARNH